MVWWQHQKAGLLTHGAEHALPIHPTQLYDAFLGLVLFGILIWVRHRKRFHGQVFITWMLIYPIFRSTVEIFRGDDVERGFIFRIVSEPLNAFLGLPEGSATFFSTSQFISLCFVITASIILWRRRGQQSEAIDAPGLEASTTNEEPHVQDARTEEKLDDADT